MKFHNRFFTVFVVVACLFIVACTSQAPLSGTKNIQPTQSGDIVTKTPFQPSQLNLFISPGVPEEWQSFIQSIKDVKIVTELNEAGLSFVPESHTSLVPLFTSKMVFAAAVPFLTVNDEISMDEIMALWDGSAGTQKYKTLIVSQRTHQILKDFWGPNSGSVSEVAEDQLLTSATDEVDSIALLSFDEITPNWKVLKINGASPLDKPLDEAQYPLIFSYQLTNLSASEAEAQQVAQSFGSAIPQTNRDESKMTVVIMSGTTALTRGTAYKILLKGTDYPIEAVKDWFLSADIRHVSNEIAFAKDCPTPDPFSSSLRFCAPLNAIEVLEKLGVNVVELTGNHENDYGTEDFVDTLNMYKERGWSTFGAGMNPEEARKPLLLNNNGNKIAFIGCNPVGPNNAWVKDNYPGVANCDFDYLDSQIKSLKEQGYVVITTYQHNEVYDYMYSDLYRTDFRNAVQAGADIVQGSQAHYPMGFELIGNSLIHYGLGNFLFDQMDYPVVGTRREFIDRHIIYNGKYINTELLTALLTDWSKPVPMSSSDRAQFLTDLFEASKKRWP